MMIWNKLHTLMRAGVRESVEKVTDANAVRIYQQEIVDAEAVLARRREALAGMIAARRDLEREIDATRGRIRSREQQLQALQPDQCTEALLQLAAREIVTLEAQLELAQERHVEICGRISREELSLRQLLRELSGHRRELKVLQAQLSLNRGQPRTGSCDTVAGRLAALRDTRNSLCAGVSACDDLEAGVREAEERISGDPVERLLAEQGQDRESQRVAAVVERLRSLAQPSDPGEGRADAPHG